MRGCALIVVWLLERSFFRMCIPPCGGEFDFLCGGTIRVLLPHAVWMPRMRIGCCDPAFREICGSWEARGTNRAPIANRFIHFTAPKFAALAVATLVAQSLRSISRPLSRYVAA